MIVIEPKISRQNQSVLEKTAKLSCLFRRPLLTFRALRKCVFTAPVGFAELERNLNSAYQWLCRAQDATPDGGVSAGFSLMKGWQP